MSQLPEKYKGATPGPWTQQGFYGTTDHLRVDGADGRLVALVRADHVETRSALNGKTETDYVRSSEQFANEKLIRDAPMLAFRVGELEKLLKLQNEDMAWVLENVPMSSPVYEKLEDHLRFSHDSLAASPLGIAVAMQAKPFNISSEALKALETAHEEGLNDPRPSLSYGEVVARISKLTAKPAKVPAVGRGREVDDAIGLLNSHMHIADGHYVPWNIDKDYISAFEAQQPAHLDKNATQSDEDLALAKDMVSHYLKHADGFESGCKAIAPMVAVAFHARTADLQAEIAILREALVAIEDGEGDADVIARQSLKLADEVRSSTPARAPQDTAGGV